MYLFNHPLIEDAAARFENMVALELWRAVHQWNEWGWGDFSLHYVRNKEKKEADFLIANNRKPVLLMEAKLSEEQVSNDFKNFQDALQIPAVWLVHKDGVRKLITNGRHTIGIFTAHPWLASLP